MAKSYFAILEIPSTASPEEIRAAYRRLAKAYHPDHFGGDSEHFKEIQQAYDVLGDPGKRSRYQQSLAGPQPVRQSRHGLHPAPEPLIPKRRPAVMEEVFRSESAPSDLSFFDEVLEWFRDIDQRLNRPEVGRTPMPTVNAAFKRKQVHRGRKSWVTVPVREVCSTCRGTGRIDYYECPRCMGEGYIL